MANLFIIDDDLAYNKTAELVIKKNYLFQACNSHTKAKTALNYLIEHQNNPEALPDVILLDLNMPEMDGWNFLCAYEDLLPYLTKHIDVFIITSSMDQNDELRSKAYSFLQGFFSKPLRIEILLGISNIITTNSIMRHNLKLQSSVFTRSIQFLL